MMSKIETMYLPERETAHNQEKNTKQLDFVSKLKIWESSTALGGTRQNEQLVSRDNLAGDTVKIVKISWIGQHLNLLNNNLNSGFTLINTIFTHLINSVRSQEGLFIEHLGLTRGELLWAMVYGTEKKLPTETKLLLKKVGLQHLLSVSGFNLSLIVLFLEFFLRKNSSHLFFLILLFLIGDIYLQVAGFSPALVRAAVMIGLRYLARDFFKRPFLPLYELLLSSLIVIFLFPGSLAQLGFQLSTAAIAGIILFQPLARYFRPQNLLLRIFYSGIAISVVVFASTLPLVGYYFGEISTLALFVNICLSWSIPFLTAVGMVYSAFLLVSSGFGAIFAIGIQKIIDIFMSVIEQFSFWPSWIFIFPQPMPLWWMGVWWGSLLALRKVIFSYFKRE